MVTTRGAAYHPQMNRSEVQAWLDGYVEAWRKNQRELVGGLFAEDAIYRYRPYPRGKTLEGHEAIVRGWLAHSDGPDDWEASYEVFTVDGNRAVAVGTTRYFATDDVPEKLYHNCFLLRFAPNGRCAEFTEYYMLDQKE